MASLELKIQSILGGQGPSSHFMASDQFLGSIGIDPARPIKEPAADFTIPIIVPEPLGSISSGILRPVSVYNGLSSTSGANVMPPAILWMKGSPKTAAAFAYGATGSVYAIGSSNFSVTALSDANLGNTLDGLSGGNGLEYYDNYMYFALNTDIARYGPLNGSPTLNPSYWVGTLGKAPLENNLLPQTNTLPLNTAPNHMMHRHSDGKLYILDIQGNQGVLHMISTSKTTVEGDTDNGSTAQKLTFGYGLWPTAIESYGNLLVISLVESAYQLDIQHRAKIAFWDTTSPNFNSITWVEYPDIYISALKNINGVLYVYSGSPIYRGVRVTQFVGGYTYKELAFIPNATLPYAGAVDGDSNRLLFGTTVFLPEVAAVVMSIGLENAALGRGQFAPFRSSLTASSFSNQIGITAILTNRATDISIYDPIFASAGYSFLGSGNEIRIDFGRSGGDYSVSKAKWWSQLYKIGQPFQVKRIRIPLSQAVAGNMTVTPTLYFDNGNKSQVLPAINTANFPNSEMVAKIDTAGDGNSIVRGENNLWVELAWSGASLCAIDLPIILDIDLINE